MQYLRKLFSNPHYDERLIGLWEIETGDASMESEYGTISISFHQNGTMTHEFIELNNIISLNLTYQTRNGIIYADQLSALKHKITTYTFDQNDMLIMEFEGIITKLRRSVRDVCRT